MNLAKNIKTARKNCGYTQDELACILSVSTVEIKTWENDKSIPTDRQLVFLSQVLDIPINRLINGNVTRENGQVKIDIRTEKLL